LALLQNSDFIIILETLLSNIDVDLGKCMAVVDVNDYRLGMSVVVDCYKMQNV
jgi:hypothetical protein